LWFNVVLQVVLLWALLFWIVTFAIIGSAVGLALSVLCTVAYYVGIVLLAWHERPHHSIVAVVVNRLRGDLADEAARATAQAAAADPPSTPLPLNSATAHPYLHSPPWRSAQSHVEDDLFSRARSMDSEPLEEDDENDDERQARIEEEMARRDVSIFTVPKRRLVVRN